MPHRHGGSSPSSQQGRDESCDANNNNNNGSSLLSGDNLLRLALKKPDRWKWELTTSSSSPNISFPKIQLFDGESGELMVEVDQPDCVIRSSDCADGRQRYGRSRTSMLVREKLPTSGDSLADIFHQLSSKGLGHKLSTSGSKYHRLAANGEPGADGRTLQKSKSANEIAPPEVPIVRRKSRRSVSSRSSSILERISELYGRSSTDDDDDESVAHPVPQDQEPQQDRDGGGVTIEEMPPDAPSSTRTKIYKLVRSNAGTLMVREESFHTQRSLRRRQRESLHQQQPGPDCDRYVQLDEPLDDRPAATRYEQEINHIDHLLSRVMLSHDLQTEEPRLRLSGEAPNIRISTASSQDGEATTGCHVAPVHPNGRLRRTRQPRRSCSFGSHRSISSGRSNSPSRRRRGSSCSTSEEEQRLLHDRGSSPHSNSLKRRGRTRRRGEPRDSPTAKGNAEPLDPASPLPFWPAGPPAANLKSGNRHHRRRCRSASGGDGGGGDGKRNALALASCGEPLRLATATVGEFSSRRTPFPADIDVPTIGPIGAVQPRECSEFYVTPSPSSQCPARPCPTRPSAPAASGSVPDQQQQQQQQQFPADSSSSDALSSLSPLTATASSSSSSVEFSQPATDQPPPVSRELARSSSVPCGVSLRRSPARATDPLRRSIPDFPLSGDWLRSVYMMQEPTEASSGSGQPPAPKRQLLAPPEMQQMLPPPPPPPPTYAEALARRAPPEPPTVALEETEPAAEGAAAGETVVTAKPPTGLVRPHIRVTSEDDVEVPVAESELANTVEPPMRTNRSLKYYVRRHRSSFHRE